MNWIYYTKQNWDSQGFSPAQQVFVRALSMDKNDQKEVSKIIEMNVFALDFYFGLTENPLSDAKYQQIYSEELAKKEYFLEELPINESQNYLLKKVALYLKGEKFDKDELLSWVSTCFAIWGYEQPNFEETDINDFQETNPVLQLFSLDNVKKFEDKLGKEWWKQKD